MLYNIILHCIKNTVTTHIKALQKDDKYCCLFHSFFFAYQLFYTNVLLSSCNLPKLYRSQTINTANRATKLFTYVNCIFFLFIGANGIYYAATSVPTVDAQNEYTPVHSSIRHQYDGHRFIGLRKFVVLVLSLNILVRCHISSKNTYLFTTSSQ